MEKGSLVDTLLTAEAVVGGVLEDVFGVVVVRGVR